MFRLNLRSRHKKSAVAPLALFLCLGYFIMLSMNNVKSRAINLRNRIKPNRADYLVEHLLYIKKRIYF